MVQDYLLKSSIGCIVPEDTCLLQTLPYIFSCSMTMVMVRLCVGGGGGLAAVYFDKISGLHAYCSRNTRFAT